MVSYGHNWMIFEDNNKYGIKNDNKVILETIYDDVKYIDDTVYQLQKGDNKFFGFLKSNVIIPIDSHSCFYKNNGLIILSKHAPKVSFMNDIYDQYTGKKLVSVGGLLYSDIKISNGLMLEFSDSAANFTNFVRLETKINKEINRFGQEVYDEAKILSFDYSEKYTTKRYLKPNGNLLGFIVDQKGKFYFVNDNLEYKEIPTNEVTFETKISYNNGVEIASFKDTEKYEF